MLTSPAAPGKIFKLRVSVFLRTPSRTLLEVFNEIIDAKHMASITIIKSVSTGHMLFPP